MLESELEAFSLLLLFEARHLPFRKMKHLLILWFASRDYNVSALVQYSVAVSGIERLSLVIHPTSKKFLFFKRSLRGFVVSARFGANFPMWLIIPSSVRTSGTFCVLGSLVIATTFLDPS